MKNIILFVCLIILQTATTFAQQLKPGFDVDEYIELMRLCARHADTAYSNTIPEPQYSKFVYRSPVVGLENQWDLWIMKEKIAVISIRGTIQNPVSWMANFYSAMVPAKGEITIAENETFHYDLAPNPKAAVHVGWLLCTAFLSKDMLPKVDSCYKAGIHDVIIMGHSQGGAIAFLLTSYLRNLQQTGALPGDIRFKTYCSAGPKPGNLYYAYDYEAATAGGWAFNVVNTADWVPETPLSVQTSDDFNTTNPFTNIKPIIRKQKFPNNLLFRYAYNRMDKPAKRARRNYQKYLGRTIAKSVKKHLTGFQPPAYYPSSHYVRTGVTIVLQAGPDYYAQYPDNPQTLFVHHLFAPYLYLAERLKK